VRLAIVYPPFYAKCFNENLPTVDDEFGLFPHLGFGWVARGAKSAGWEVRLWDAPATKLTLDQVVCELEAYSPDLVVFSAHAAQTFRDMLLWARAIKQRTGLPVLVGGYEAKALPHEVMEHHCFDFLCGGEAHIVLPPFLRAFERGAGYDKVPQIFYRNGHDLRHTFNQPKAPFRDYPTPDRSIFPNERYYSHVSQRRDFTIGMSSIGCPYSCTFCCMRRSGFDQRSAEQVVDEMEECVHMGIREIDWFDPLMLHDRERALEISREVKRRELDIIWSCRARVDSLSFHKTDHAPDAELIEALAEGGCRRIYFGIESGDDSVLKQMKKGQAATDNQRRTLACAAEAGIMSLGFFMLGAPGDTPQTVERTVSYALSLPLSYAQFQIAVIKPHTELEREHLIEGVGLDYWREYVRGTVDEYLLPNTWTQMEREELETLARRAYLRFYARPRYAASMLRRIESPEELARYLRVAAQLLLRPLRSDSRTSLFSRVGRSARAFLEAALTAANPGARHLVFQEGGGLTGALRLATREFAAVRRPRLTPEIVARVRQQIGDTASSSVRVLDRYATYFDHMSEQGGADHALPIVSETEQVDP